MKDLLTILGLCVLFAITAFAASIYSKYPDMRLIPPQPDLQASSDVLDSGKRFTCGDFIFSLDIPETEMQFSARDDSNDRIQSSLYTWAGKYQPDIFGSISVDCRSLENVEQMINIDESELDSYGWPSTKWETDFEKNYEIIKDDSSAMGVGGYLVAKSRSADVDYAQQYAYMYIAVRVDKPNNLMNFIRILYLSPKYDADSTAVFNKLTDSLKYVQ